MISESYIVGTLLHGKKELKHIALNSVKPYQISGTYNRIVFEGCKQAERRFGSISKDIVSDFVDGLDPSFLDDYIEFIAQNLKEIEGHCQQVVDAHTKRSVISGLEGVLLDAESYQSSRELISDAEGMLSETAAEIGMPGLVYSQMIERDKNKPRYEKLDFGDPFWNHTFFRHCGGHKGQMTTLFGDSKHGKSTAAMMFARMLIENGYQGLYTSFEDIDRKYAEHVRRGLQDKEVIDRLIITDHSQGCSTLDDIVTTTKYHKAINDISFLMVDNAQIVDVDGVNFWDETKKLVTISPRLSRLAIELDIWVLLLSQISNERSRRSGYERQPKIHDIYGSGQIRKDSYMGISVFKLSEVDDLIVKNEFNGDIRGVKHPNGNGEMWPLSTVLMRQELIREGEKYWKSVILNIRDDGLWRPVEEKQESPF